MYLCKCVSPGMCVHWCVHWCVQVTMLMLMLMPGKDIKSLGTRVIGASGTPAFCMGAGMDPVLLTAW